MIIRRADTYREWLILQPTPEERVRGPAETLLLIRRVRLDPDRGYGRAAQVPPTSGVYHRRIPGLHSRSLPASAPSRSGAGRVSAVVKPIQMYSHGSCSSA